MFQVITVASMKMSVFWVIVQCSLVEAASIIALMMAALTPSSNKPTIKLTKGGVLHKRKTSFHARLHHSCVRKALLQMVNRALQLKLGFAYANGSFVVAESL